MTLKRKRVEAEFGRVPQKTPKRSEPTSGRSATQEDPDHSNGLETPINLLGSQPHNTTPIRNPGNLPHVEAEVAEELVQILRGEGKVLFKTPTKVPTVNGNSRAATPVARYAARSDRHKTARNIFKQAIDEQLIDEDSADDESLAQEIWNAEEDEDELVIDETEEDPPVKLGAPPSPLKRGRKSTRRRVSPPAPENLPAHERYFFQNRPGGNKTSSNTISSLSLLSHEDYAHHINKYEDPHDASIEYLHALHSRSFPQWNFELVENFSVCLYGYGSKARLVTAFADHLHATSPPGNHPQTIMVNGYVPKLTIHQILSTVATCVYGCAASELPSDFGTQPHDMLDSLLRHLDAEPPISPVFLFINSLDASPLRRAPTPSILASLSASPHIHLLATCDTPSFPLLWDNGLRERYNWLFHDATMFESYGRIEIENVIDEVNDLLGRSGRNIKGKEGVGFVLQSLPENARNLYRVLIAELLAGMGDDARDDEGLRTEASGALGRNVRAESRGIEYRTLYQKASEEFICSSEMSFRTLLKEFLDHQMVTSKKDGAGTETLGVPFRQEEMEAILEDLM